MFRRKLVAHGNALVNVPAQYRERLFERLPRRGSIGLRERLHLLRYLLVHRVDHPPVIADQYRPCHHVVLRLRDKIGRDDLRIRSFVRDDEDLARSREHVDAAVPVHDRFRGRDPLVPRSDDDVARRHRGYGLLAVRARFGAHAVRHGADGLCAAHAQHDVGAGDVRSCEGYGRGSGRGEDDVGTSGRAGGDDGHDDGGGEGVPSSGGVASGGTTRTDALPGLPPRNIHLHVHHAPSLRLGEHLDPIVNVQQRLPLVVVERVEGRSTLRR
mmetsp:Transcript_10602/g.26114  ORF Transcript_10602/g.26114 Transcript_10602/m.26114 type:complete len:270 (+) Transcript_10602:535-1344(+)